MKQPNLKQFFTGTKTQYFALYKATVESVRGVNETLRIGGPATSNYVPDTRFDGDVEDIGPRKESAKV